MEHIIPNSSQILLFGNFDETSIQFDMAGGCTYDFHGVKQIFIQTTTGVKMRVTVLMTILSDGTVLRPLFVFKSKKATSEDLRKKYAKDCLLFSNAKGWITEDILL